MSFPLQLLLCAAATAGLASAFTLETIGSCSVNVESKTDFNLDQFANENDGIWSFKLVPHTDQYNPVDWMFLTSNPIADSGVYQTGIFYEKVDSEPDVLNQLILFDTGNGVIQAKPVYSNTTVEFKMFFLDYQPGSYAFFYICSDDGANDAVDYRFVLSHGRLTTEQKSQIKNMESDFEFKGTLRYLTEGQTNVGSRSVRGH